MADGVAVADIEARTVQCYRSTWWRTLWLKRPVLVFCCIPSALRIYCMHYVFSVFQHRWCLRVHCIAETVTRCLSPFIFSLIYLPPLHISQGINNLQSTCSGFGFVSAENVFKVSSFAVYWSQGIVTWPDHMTWSHDLMAWHGHMTWSNYFFLCRSVMSPTPSWSRRWLCTVRRQTSMKHIRYCARYGTRATHLKT